VLKLLRLVEKSLLVANFLYKRNICRGLS